ncbi:hypothetical protein [Burkholderia ambifaria]|uniref:hypothetical protein n=1 Tax=Burkholderia ambifaria TaxID=152480 RepID=UPI00158A5B3C|nr:hypothetical protein [Burkholderia ambifaria]
MTANHSGGPGRRVSTHAQAVAFGEDILREEMSLQDRAALIEHRGRHEHADVKESHTGCKPFVNFPGAALV